MYKKRVEPMRPRLKVNMTHFAHSLFTLKLMYTIHYAMRDFKPYLFSVIIFRLIQLYTIFEGIKERVINDNMFTSLSIYICTKFV